MKKKMRKATIKYTFKLILALLFAVFMTNAIIYVFDISSSITVILISAGISFILMTSITRNYYDQIDKIQYEKE